MKTKIISINKWINKDGYRSAIIYEQNNIKHKIDILTETELTENQIKNYINEN